ncbi:MAG TPA: AMP-binding protein, partial [Aestuariivirga sp.]|nr:AMP-binding protein [Aestuariivirga sp.]
MFDAAVETLPWGEQVLLDDQLYRQQIEYVLAHSRFYGDKLGSAGFTSAAKIGGLGDIARLPFTEKSEIRASRSDDNPIGGHLCVARSDIVRIYSTSGTTGTPSYIPLTVADLDNWVTTSARSYAAAGIKRGEGIVTTYNAGPFVAAAALAAFDRLGLCHIPVGTGNSERLMTAIKLLKPKAAVMTPSHAAHLAEWAETRKFDLKGSSVRRLLVAGEPGGGEPALRARLEEAWGARVTEAMGIGDIAASLWGECEQRHGMHFGGRDLVHFELIDPETGKNVPLED